MAGQESPNTGRRGLLGTWVQLRNGGRLRLLPRTDNLPYYEKLRKLEAELRVAKGLSLEEKLTDQLSHSEYTALVARAQVGTVVTGWSDFDGEDGKEWPCRTESGELDEDAGVAVLLAAGVTADFVRAMEPIDAAFAKDQEIAEGNSSEPSAGSSATVGS